MVPAFGADGAAETCAELSSGAARLSVVVKSFSAKSFDFSLRFTLIVKLSRLCSSGMWRVRKTIESSIRHRTKS
ncbi:hypothetical protein SAMN05421759_1256 [Roseivivax lentus]|uniref:Uncharacterized protein n=2 Tax=Roseivivax lentus TaxID=633194 RepID=A0A1N7Q2M0_9RHOB|nr:hypothetical protein SAMN05421759_1256 [Roseivivax lentus]